MDKNVKAARMATLERVAGALTANRMEARVVESREELLEILRGMLGKGDSIASGGSMTLEETGVNALLSGGDYDFYFRGRTDEKGEPVDVLRAAFSCDWYFSSSNAITEDGCLYNADGNANRVAALCYGPRKVVIVAGYNKIVRNLHAAAERVLGVPEGDLDSLVEAGMQVQRLLVNNPRPVTPADARAIYRQVL